MSEHILAAVAAYQVAPTHPPRTGIDFPYTVGQQLTSGMHTRTPIVAAGPTGIPARGAYPQSGSFATLSVSGRLIVWGMVPGQEEPALIHFHSAYDGAGALLPPWRNPHHPSFGDVPEGSREAQEMAEAAQRAAQMRQELQEKAASAAARAEEIRRLHLSMDTEWFDSASELCDEETLSTFQEMRFLRTDLGRIRTVQWFDIGRQYVIPPAPLGPPDVDLEDPSWFGPRLLAQKEKLAAAPVEGEFQYNVISRDEQEAYRAACTERDSYP